MVKKLIFGLFELLKCLKKLVKPYNKIGEKTFEKQEKQSLKTYQVSKIPETEIEHHVYYKRRFKNLIALN